MPDSWVYRQNWLLNTVSLEMRYPFTCMLTSLSWGDMQPIRFLKNGLGQFEKNTRKMTVEIDCFRPLWHNAWSLRAPECWSLVLNRSNVRAFVLLTFIHVGNEKKRQNLKIYLLKFEEIWQKSCSHRTSINESLKIHFEQRSFVTQSNFS